AVDGHKWLQTPYDCGFAIVRDAEAHRRAMSISASYLPPAEGAGRDPSAYAPELSRRARGFGAWAGVRQLGRGGSGSVVEGCCALAARLASRLAAEPGVTLVSPVELNQFMLRFVDGAGDDDGDVDGPGGDALTAAVIRGVQQDGVAFIGGADWRGRWVM